MEIYVSKDPISNQVYTRAYRLPLNIRVEPTYWARVNASTTFLPLKHEVYIKDITLFEYTILILKHWSKK